MPQDMYQVNTETLYIPEGEDVGHFLSDRLFDIPGISRTLTTMTFKAF